MIGNSSAGIREAPYFNIPSIDIGTRQNNRIKIASVINCNYQCGSIIEAIVNLENNNEINNKIVEFGHGNSDKLFLDLLAKNDFWEISCQKQFVEMSDV